MKVFCYMGLLLLVVGCAPKSNGNIIDPERCDTIQGIMKYDEDKAQGKIQKKIFCDFENKGEMVIEYLNASKKEVNRIIIQEKEIEDIEAIFNDAVKDQCPDCLAASKEDADVVIKANIIRLVGHVKDYDVSGDESMIFSGGDREEKIEYQAALTVETDINGKASSYDHIIDLSIDRKTHVEKMYAVLAASTEKKYTTEFITKYDLMPLATGAIIFTENMEAIMGFNSISYNKSGYFDIYDLSDMEVERHLDFSQDHIAWWWAENKDQDVRNEVIALYSSGGGAMRYLVYDYVKNLLAEVHYAQ